MNLQVKIDSDKLHAVPLNVPGPSLLSRTWSTLWSHRWLFAAVTAGVVALNTISLALTPSQYTSEAVLELNFNRQEPANSATAIRQLASVDPGALVNGAAQDLGSRSNVSQVVTRLHLDEDPALTRQSTLSSVVNRLRGLIGLGAPQLPPHEIAVNDILRKLTISQKAHYYMIGAAFIDADPTHAAKVANALVIEHLRSERLKELLELRTAAIAELAALSQKVGTLHPQYLDAQARIDHLEGEMKAVQASDADPAKFLPAGQYLTLAEPIMTPTGPKRFVIMVLGLFGALGLGLLAALAVDPLRNLWRSMR